MTDCLHSHGFYYLNDIVNPQTSTFLDQGWLSSDFVGLVDVQDGLIWKGFIAILKVGNIILSGNADELVWIHSKTGKYTPNDGYTQLIKENEDIELIWWWKAVLKLKCPLKSKIFMWFLLSNKALTWDILCRKGREGLGRCYLCKVAEESNFRLGVDCIYTKSIWYEIECKLKLKNLWVGDYVKMCLKSWCSNVDLKDIISLPLIVLWYIWKPKIFHVLRINFYYLYKLLFKVWGPCNPFHKIIYLSKPY